MPADTQMQQLTFLNDKKINGELYALLMAHSTPDETKRTVVNKKDLPRQVDICSQIGLGSRSTLAAHLKYLIERGYVVEEGDKYYLPNQEEIYFMLPLTTLKFLNDTLKEQVIKIYLYLGQRWKYKKNEYVFTIDEIATHIGIKLGNHARNYEIINNALICLKNNELIDYVEFYENEKPRKRLTNFSLTPKTK